MESHRSGIDGYLSRVGGGCAATGDRTEGRVQQRGSALPVSGGAHRCPASGGGAAAASPEQRTRTGGHP